MGQYSGLQHISEWRPQPVPWIKGMVGKGIAYFSTSAKWVEEQALNRTDKKLVSKFKLIKKLR